MSETIVQTGPLWRWTGSNGFSWFFVTIDNDAGEELNALEAMRRLEFGRKRGFRSLKVKARIGETEWSTSCFPSDDGGWLLPVKAQIRKQTQLTEGSLVTVELEPV